MKKCRIGIIGENNLLTGAILNRLKSWRFPADVIQIYRNDDPSQCEDIDCVVAQNEILFICCRCEKHKELIEKGIAAGCITIDMWADTNDDQICIAPAVNGNRIQRNTHYVKLPQMESLQLIQSLAKLQEHFQVESITVSTYQSLAKADFDACQELKEQMQNYLHEESFDSKYMPYRDALNHLPVLFNPLPQIDYFTPEGFTCSEKHLDTEYKQVFGVDVPVYATCVWIASMRGASMSIQVKLKDTCTREDLIEILSKGDSSLLIDDIEHQMYPIPSDVIHDYRCFIGRVRCFDEHTIGLWSVCDEIEMLSANGVMAAFIFVNNDWLRNE